MTVQRNNGYIPQISTTYNKLDAHNLSYIFCNIRIPKYNVLVRHLKLARKD
jgi:hypothetical protein